jgi:hypothetical protein
MMEEDPRTREMGLDGSQRILFHMSCELKRQEEVRRLRTMRVIRRGMRLRRWVYFWRRVVSFKVGPRKGPGFPEL